MKERNMASKEDSFLLNFILVPNFFLNKIYIKMFLFIIIQIYRKKTQCKYYLIFQ